MPHTLGSSISKNPYHIPIIRKSFNLRNLALLFDDINEEMASAIHDMFPERLEDSQGAFIVRKQSLPPLLTTLV